MNRHFFNFIAAFNASTKNKRWTFCLPVRNRFVLTFLDFVVRERLVESYRLIRSLPAFRAFGASPGLRGRHTSFCYPVEITLKHELVKKIYSVSTPGKYHYMSKRKLAQYIERRIGARGVVIVSSPRLGRLCNAKELIALGEGGLVVCVVFIS